MTTDQLLILIKAGEDSQVEFKEIRLGDRNVISPHADDIAGELVAFANGEGGFLFLGVSDAGAIHGIPRESVATVERWVINIATNNCDPPIRPVIYKLAIPEIQEDKLVLVVEVKRGLFVHRTLSGRYILRVGSSKRDLTPAELARLFQQRGRIFIFDEQLVLDASSEDLDEKLLNTFLGELAIPQAEILQNMRITGSDENGEIHPSVAGLLAFGRDPQHYLPNSFIEAAIYRGTELDSDDLIHHERIDGPIARQIDDAVEFVERRMLKPARKDLGRVDYPQYAMRPIYEAIVNAVAHRDYSLWGAKIRLYLFADRLELYSPGGLPNTLTVETMPYRVFTRNQLLVNFLSRMRSPKFGRIYLESRGEGVRRILQESERHAGRRPEYRLIGEELLLTIWAKPSPHEGR